ncbi:MAG: DNA-directed RNA polymerase subunit H [Methanobacteriaceae archaeon]
MKKDILKNDLVPEHSIMSEEDIKKTFKDLDFEKEQLPKIKVEDPVSIHIGAKVGDVLEIIRESATAGTFITYRIVIP